MHSKSLREIWLGKKFSTFREKKKEKCVSCTHRLLCQDGCRLGIEYKENLGDVLKQFTEQFGKVIPKSVLDGVTDIEKSAMVQSLSISDNENPNKIYCNRVKRNSDGGQRSEFNADKTKLLRPSLFEHFCNEPNISFCYYTDPAKENDDATILRKFSK